MRSNREFVRLFAILLLIAAIAPALIVRAGTPANGDWPVQKPTEVPADPKEKPDVPETPADPKEKLYVSNEEAAPSPDAGPDRLPDVADPSVIPPAPPACGPITTRTFSNTTPTVIPDTTTITSTIQVSGAGPYLWDLNMTTFISHTFAGDLDIFLISPQGTNVTITTDNGSGNDNVFAGTRWDDDAGDTNPPGPVTDAVYVNGVLEPALTPEEAFGAFIGENPNGVWRLRITDDLTGDSGTLNRWSLEITTLPSAPTASPRSYTNTTGVLIPDRMTVTSTLTVAGAGTFLTDLNMTTFISHTYSADLDIFLISPQGTRVTITTDNGIGGDNLFAGTRWDDDAGNTNPPGPVTDANYVSGVPETPLVVEEAMGAFIGENPNGVWRLVITDDLASDSGTLNRWSLEIATGTCGGVDLALTKTDSPDPVGVGRSLTYRLTVRNNGPSAATGVVVSDTLPLAVSFISATPSQGSCSRAGRLVTCTLGGLSNAASATVNIVVRAPASTGTLVNTASVRANQADPAPGNNTATANTAVVVFRAFMPVIRSQ